MKTLHCIAMSLIGLFAASCESATQPKSLDIYYRAFLATSIVTLTEPIMVSAAGDEAHISNAAQIARVLASLPKTCQKSQSREDSMDLRVLIYMNYGTRRRTWKASNFDYFDSSTGLVCKITPAMKEVVEQAVSRT
jgi:hypothetical protein